MINYKPYVGPRSQKNTKHTLQHIVVRRREDDDAYRIKDKMDPEAYAEQYPCIIPWTRPELYEVPVDVTSGTSKATKFEYWLVWYKTLNWEPHMWHGRNYDQQRIDFPYHRTRITKKEYWDYKTERVPLPTSDSYIY